MAGSYKNSAADTRVSIWSANLIISTGVVAAFVNVKLIRSVIAEMKYPVQYIALFILLGVLSGCSTLPRNPVPLDQILSAEIPGMPGVRAWSGKFSDPMEKDLLISVQQSLNHVDETKTEDAIPTTNVLSISGGGANGAFGAGFLYGWSQSGLRPEFKIVTGISTGALIAPFAFLGPEYDDTLKKAFTTISAEHIYVARSFSFLWSDAFADSLPLKELIKHYITEDVLQAIALSHRQGRRLFVGTTNLDAERLVIWNMGAIANSRHPGALDLFRKIILASSSIPGVFPPIMIKVEVDGLTYDEMHVDGGVKAQLFLLADTLDVKKFQKNLGDYADSETKSNIYIIRNAKMSPEEKKVPRNLGEISARSISILIKAQAMNDLKGLYNIAQQYEMEFNWVAMPSEYIQPENIDFDTNEMNKMFDLGREMGLNKNVWRKAPNDTGQNKQ